MSSSTEMTHPLLDKHIQNDADPENYLHNGKCSSPHRAGVSKWNHTLQLLLASLIGGLVVHLFTQSTVSLSSWDQTPRLVRQCPSPDPTPVKAPKKNVWKNIDIPTAVSIREWLMDPAQKLNLTHSNEASESDNWIQLVESVNPPKSEAVSYLSSLSLSTSSSQPPEAYAHAIIHHGSNDTIGDYLIGPLPISPRTTIRPWTETYHTFPIPLNAHATFNWTRLGQQFGHAFAPLDPVTRDLFNGSVLDGSLAVAGVAPMGYDGSFRRSWVQLRRNGAGSWLRPLDLFVYTDMSGTDPSLYRITKIVHNKTLYPSVSAFLSAWQEGNTTKSPPEEPFEWSTRTRRTPTRDMDDRPGPRTVLPGGARFKVDEEEQWVSWLGWEFYLGFERDMGVHLWDIRFLGERIIYEISPQEAMAQYSGFDPHQATTVWLDSAFGMGTNVRDVIIGYDCPSHAKLLPALVHEQGSTLRRNAICIFERESGRPLSRHTEGSKDAMGAVKGYELVVRSISTVGNYDYIFDYTFQLDGTVEIRVSASGYLQGGLWSPEQDAYGHQLSREGMGSLHDHVINFKVDLDVAGVENSLMAVSLEIEEKQEAWFDDEVWGPGVTQQRLVRTILPKETTLTYPPNMQGAYVILNTNATNKYHNPRGYTIHPGPLCRLTNLDSKRTEKSVEWAKSHLGVTRRKDEERKSSSGWNMNLPGNPPVDYSKFFDDESIEQEDLVVWLNLGTHHIPRAEDTPNTLTNVATSYVSLVPWNYFDEDPSMDSLNSVLINKNAQGEWVIDEGVQDIGTCVPPKGAKLAWRDVDEWDERGNVVEPKEKGHLNKVVLGGSTGDRGEL